MNDLGLLIFDMDGTLFDSMSQHATAFSRILEAEYGIPPDSSRSGYLRTAGRPLDQQFALLIEQHTGHSHVSLGPLLDRFWELVEESEPTPFPDVQGSIVQLWRAGYALAVSSSCSGDVVASKMTKSGLAGYFRITLGTDYGVPDMTKGEGHFDRIRQELHVDGTGFRRNTALVGDGEHDMAIAKTAGILGIGRLTGNNGDALKRSGADLLINTLDQLELALQGGQPGKTEFVPVSSLRATVP